MIEVETLHYSSNQGYGTSNLTSKSSLIPDSIHAFVTQLKRA